MPRELLNKSVLKGCRERRETLVDTGNAAVMEPWAPEDPVSNKKTKICIFANESTFVKTSFVTPSFGTYASLSSYPALKRRAILGKSLWDWNPGMADCGF
jgi:hypothetical protein